MKNIDKVFVYGSLMTGFWNYPVVKDSVIKVEPGKVDGKLYHLPEGFPALEIGEGEVYGELLTLREFDSVLERLDRLEGYHGVEATNLYNRVITRVETKGDHQEAYCYVWAGEGEYLLNKGTFLPKGNWREFIEAQQADSIKKTTVYYFAYGSCMCEESFKGTVKNYKILGRAFLDDRKLAFTKYSSKWGGGVADIIHAPGEIMEGILYEIEQKELESLDRREGVPWMYQREVIPVLVNGQSMHALTYVVTEKETQECPPSTKYLDTILAGAKERLSEDYIQKIRNIKTRE